MSRDIIVFNIADKQGFTASEPLRSMVPLGLQQDVISKIKEAFPEIDISDSKWIILSRRNYSLAFGFFGKDLVESLSISIHGEEDAIADVKHLCSVSGWYAIDPLTGELV